MAFCNAKPRQASTRSRSLFITIFCGGNFFSCSLILFDDNLSRYDSIISKNGGGSGTASLFGGSSDDQDALFDDAKRLIVESGKASASLLQRRLKVGYARAARILDQLEQAGILAHAEGNKPREIIVNSFDEYLPQNEETEE